MLSRPLPRALGALLSAGIACGCAETATPLTGVYHPTLIQLSPDNFLSGVPCAPGAVGSYIATLYDVEYDGDGSAVPEDAGAGGQFGDIAEGRCPADTRAGAFARTGFALPSSGPISCSKPVAFSRVVAGHRYRAEIQGFSQAAAQLAALAPGAPLVVGADGERVEPSWRWTCGDTCPEMARSYVARDLTDCALDSEGSTAGIPSGPAAVTVALSTASGAPSCGTASDQVDHFEVTTESGQSASGACGDTLVLEDVPAPGALSIGVLAYELGNSAPTWGTSCVASPVPGLEVQASCPVLTSQGALDVDPAQALAAVGTDCAGLGSLPGELELVLLDDLGVPVGQPRFVNAASCSASVRFTGVASGPARVQATLLSGGTALGQAICNASILPASATTAQCGSEP